MDTKLRRFSSAVLCVLAAGLGAASLAWACVGAAGIEVSPTSGRSGSQVTVRPDNLTKVDPSWRVEIRWGSQKDFMHTNSAGARLLKAVSGEEFARGVKITIPKAEPGSYSIQASVSSSSLEPARAPFTVTAAKQTGGTNPPQRPQGRPGTRNQAADPTGGERTAPATGDADGGAVRSTAAPTGPRQAAPRPSGTVPPGDHPSARSATGDLWSGFAPGQRSSLVPKATDRLEPPDRPGSQFTVGAGVLGLGVLALLAGFGVAELRRRRRAPAGAGQPD